MTTEINVNAIVNQLQDLVVRLKDDKSLTSVHAMAANVRKQVRDHDESVQLVKTDRERRLASQESGDIRILNTNNQLHEYSQENRKLRKLYEDSLNALEIVMDRHRTLVVKSMKKPNNDEPIKNMLPDIVTVNSAANKKTAEVIAAMNIVMNSEKERFSKNSKEILRLQGENEVMRALLELKAQTPESAKEDSNQTVIDTTDPTNSTVTLKKKQDTLTSEEENNEV